MPVTSGTTTGKTISSSGSTSSSSRSGGPGGGSLQAPNRTAPSSGGSGGSGVSGSKGGGASTQRPGAGGNAGTVSKASTSSTASKPSTSSTSSKSASNTTTVNKSITSGNSRSYQEQTKINQMRDQYSEYGRAYRTIEAPPDPRTSTANSAKVVDPSRSNGGGSVADARARSGDVAPSRATPQQSKQISNSIRNATNTAAIRGRVDSFLKSGPPNTQRPADGKTSKPTTVANNSILGPRQGLYGPYDPKNSFQKDWVEKTLTGRALNALVGGALTQGSITNPARRNGSATDGAWGGGPTNPARPAGGKTNRPGTSGLPSGTDSAWMGNGPQKVAAGKTDRQPPKVAQGSGTASPWMRGSTPKVPSPTVTRGIYGPYDPNSTFQRDWAEKTLTGRTLNAIAGGALTRRATPGSATDTAWAGGPTNPARPAPGKTDLQSFDYAQALADSLNRSYQRDLADAMMGVNRPQYSVPGVSHFSSPMMNGTPDQQLMDRIVGDPTGTSPAGTTAQRTIMNVANNTPVATGKLYTDRVLPEPTRIGQRSALYDEQIGPQRPVNVVPAAGTPTTAYNTNAGVTNPFYRDAAARRQQVVNQIALARGQAPAAPQPAPAPAPAASRPPTQINVPGGGLPVATDTSAIVDMARPPTGPIGAQGGLGVAGYPGAVNTPPMNVPSGSSTQQRDEIYNGPRQDVAGDPAPSQEGDYPADANPSQNDGQAQSLGELRNRYEYEKQQVKDGIRQLPGRIWDAIVRGDIRGIPQPDPLGGSRHELTDNGLNAYYQILAELNAKLLAQQSAAQNSIISPNKSQLDLVFNTFV